HKLNQSGIPAVASFHAGTYACNAALYLALHASSSQSSVGFLHIPHRPWPFGMRTGILHRAINLCLDVLRSNAPGVNELIAAFAQKRYDAAKTAVGEGGASPRR